MQNGYSNSNIMNCFLSAMAKNGPKWVRSWGFVKLAKRVCLNMKILFDNDFYTKNTLVLSYFKKNSAF